jgi:hypothetical protein
VVQVATCWAVLVAATLSTGAQDSTRTTVGPEATCAVALTEALELTHVNDRSNCEDPAISAHGRHVTFRTNATNLVPGDTDSLDVADTFVRDFAP